MPEKSLLLSVIDRAVQDALPFWGSRREAFVRRGSTPHIRAKHSAGKIAAGVYETYLARLWLLGPSNPNEAFSLEWCAHMLGWDASKLDAIRTQIRSDIPANNVKMFEYMKAEIG